MLYVGSYIELDSKLKLPFLLSKLCKTCLSDRILFHKKSNKKSSNQVKKGIINV